MILKNILIKNRKFLIHKLSVFCLPLLLISALASCSFLQDDGFFETVEDEVKVANADKMKVYLRYGDIKYGKTSPADADSFIIKNNVKFSVTATTNSDYRFYKWAAFSTKQLSPSKSHAIEYTDRTLEHKENDEEFKDYHDLWEGSELGETIVKFDNPFEPTSSVTVYETRDDIWIVPVVVNRPYIANTFPESSPIVRNARLRVQFSVPMEKESIIGHFTIKEGTYSGEFELNFKDITDMFDYDISDSGKLVSFVFKSDSPRTESGFTSGSKVQISFEEEVMDVYGSKMSSSQNKSWKVGSSYDRTAPIIQELSGGIGTDFFTFQSTGTKEADTATSSIDNALYTSSIVSQRTTGKVNIYLYAQDIAGVNSVPLETDVFMAGLKAEALIDMNGKALDSTSDKNKIDSVVVNYMATENASEVEGDFVTIAKEKSGGWLYTYDISSLPDGLIKIDVWTYDSTGNDSLNNYDPSLDNGYKSIFVVKDTTAPDIESQLVKVKSSSASAPFGWYNNNTIDPIEMYDAPSNQIVDTGHPKLCATHDKLFWIFRLGDDTKWTASVTDSAWKSLAYRYEVGQARVDNDGAVSITMRIMDDLGNMTNAVPIQSVLYDNTKSVISGILWVDAAGNTAINVSKPVTVPDSSILKLPFVEELCGIKIIGLTVKDSSGNIITNAFDKASVWYSESGPQSQAVKLSLDDDKTVIENVLNSKNYDLKNPVFTESSDYLYPLATSDAVTSGNLYIKNLTLGESDGAYTVTVRFYDSALNRSEPKSIVISHDTTPPVVNRVVVEDLVSRIPYGSTNTDYWLSSSVYDSARQVNKASVTVTVTENGSGINFIGLGANAHLTSSSQLSVSGKALVQGTDYILDISSNSISLGDSYLPKIFATSGPVKFTVTNVLLDNPDSADGNKVSVSLKDFVGNTGSNAEDSRFKLFVDDTSSSPVYAVYTDKISPVLSKSGVSDGLASSAGDETLYASYTYNDSEGKDVKIKQESIFTDQNTVNLSLTLSPEAPGSGVKKIVLSGAVFTSSTAITVDSSSLAASEFSLSGNTVTFAKPFTGANKLVFTNVELSGNDSYHKVGAVSYDLTGWASSNLDSNSILIDRVKPVCGSLNWSLIMGVEGITNAIVVKSQNLMIPFTEDGSGIRVIRLDIEGLNGASHASSTPFVSTGQDAFKLLYISSSSTEKTEVPSSSYEIKGNCLIFKDNALYKSGTFYLENITVATDLIDKNEYKVSVHLTDAALNGGEDKNTKIKIDSSDPALEAIEINRLIVRKTNASDSGTDWIASADFTQSSVSPSKITADLKIKEDTAGVKSITLGENATLTPTHSIKVTYSDSTSKTLVSGTDYEVDSARRVITLKNPAYPVLKDSGEFTVTISGITLSDNGSPKEDSLKALVKLTDFALNTGSTSSKTVTGLNVDYTNPLYQSLVITDRGIEKDSRFASDGTVKAQSGYTNDHIVDLTLNGAVEAGSGINGIKLVSGASFIFDGSDKTTVSIKIGEGEEENCTFTKKSDSEIDFTYSYISSSSAKAVITVRNVKLSNPDTDGLHTISAQLRDLSKWYSASVSGSIILDKTPPVWKDIPVFVAQSNTASDVFPKPLKGSVVISSSETKDYFYIKGVSTEASVLKLSAGYIDTNFAGCDWVENDNTSKAIATAAASYETPEEAKSGAENIAFETDGDNVYSIVLRDKAGNISESKSFHVIKDTDISVTLGGLKNDASSDGLSLTSVMTKGDSRETYHVYLEKEALTDGVYRNRFSTSDGQTAFVSVDLTSFRENTWTAKDSAEDKHGESGLAYYAISLSSDTAPSSNAEAAKDFDKWIAFDKEVSLNAKVWIPEDNTEKGPYYLWLKDNVGNTRSLQIRTLEHENAGNNETWLGKASVTGPQFVNYTSGTAPMSSTDAEPESLRKIDGSLVTSDLDAAKGNVTYFNSNIEKFGLSLSEPDTGILFKGASSASEYPVRFALLKKESAPTKADAESLWQQPDTLASASVAYSFTDVEYFGTHTNFNDTASSPATATSAPDYEMLWYIIEDACGNIKTGRFYPGCETAGTTPSVWKYDNEAPVVKIRGETVKPSETAPSSSDLSALVPNCYGVQIYYDNTTIWTPPLGQGEDVSETPGTNATRLTEKNLYFDVDITDSSRITQYYYSTSETASLTDSDSDGNLLWKNVTEDFKVDTCIPLNLIETAKKPLYLHLRDFAGNIRNERLTLGEWQLDNTAPAFVSGTFDPEYKLKENSYYAVPKETDGVMGVQIAFSAVANDKTSVKVAIPWQWFTEVQSGWYGYSLTKNAVPPSSNEVDDEFKPSIELLNGTHYTAPNEIIKADGQKDYESVELRFNLYVYDMVGNCLTIPINTYVDVVAPTFKLEFDIKGSGEFNHPVAGHQSMNLGELGNTGLIYDFITKKSAVEKLVVEKEYNHANELEGYAGYSEDNPYIIYASPTITGHYFIGQFTAFDDKPAGETGGISDIQVDRKLASQTSYTDGYLQMSNLINTYGTTSDDKDHRFEAKIPIDLDEQGRLYRITVSDFAGNSTIVYMKLFLDMAAPVFSENPTATATTGSINTDGTNYYYNAMKIDFKAKDVTSYNSSVRASGTDSFSLINPEIELKTGNLTDDAATGEDAVMTLNTVSDFASHESGTLSVKLKDKLGNESSSNLYVGTTEITKPWVRDTSAPVWTSGADIGTLSGSYAGYFTVSENYLLYSKRYSGKSVSIKPTSASDSGSGIMGYVLSTTVLSATYSSANFTSTSATATAGSPAFVKAGGSFTITPSAFVTGGEPDRTLHLYAVDYAGNMTGQDFIIKEDAGYPEITKMEASSSGDIFCDDSQNYYKSGAKIKVTASVSASRGTGSVFVKWYYFGNTNDIPDNESSWSSWASVYTAGPTSKVLTLPASWNAGDTLYLTLISNRYGATTLPVKLTGSGSLNSNVAEWTQDNTPPVIEVSYKSGDVSVHTSSPESLALFTGSGDKFEDSGSYLTNASGFTASVALTDNASGVGSSEVDSVSHDDEETSYDITVDSEGNTVIKSKDHVGNEASLTFTTSIDSTPPSLSALIVNNTDSTHSVNANGDTLYYNPNFVSVSATASDEHGVLYALTDSEILPSAWSDTIPNMPSDADGVSLYLHAKDKVNNAVFLSFAGNADYTSCSSSSEQAGASAKWKADSSEPSDLSVTASAAVGVFTTSDGTVCYTGSPVVFDLSASDSNGIMRYAYRLSSSSTDSYDSTGSISVSPAADTSTLIVQAIDYAGNCSSPAVSVSLKKDNNEPVIKAVWDSGVIYDKTNDKLNGDAAITSGESYYTNADGFTLALSLDSSVAIPSGVKEWSCTALETGESFTPSDSTATLVVKNTSSVTITVTSNVGKAGTFTLGLIPDTQAPAVSAIILANSGTSSVNLDGTVLCYSNDNTYVSLVTDSDGTGSGSSGLYDIVVSATEPSDGTLATVAGTSLKLGLLNGAASSTVWIGTKDKVGNTAYFALSDITVKYTPHALSNGSHASQTSGGFTSLNALSAPASPTAFALHSSHSVAEGNGICIEENSIKYNAELLASSSSIGTAKLKLSMTAPSGVRYMGFKNGSSVYYSTDNTVELDLSAAIPSGDIYGVDYAGNLSSSPLSLTLVKDDECDFASEYVTTQVKTAKNGSGTTKTLSYDSDNKVTLKTGSDLKYYALSASSTAPSSWTVLSGGTIDISGETDSFYIHIKDNVGNTGVSSLWHKLGEPPTSLTCQVYSNSANASDTDNNRVLYITGFDLNYPVSKVLITDSSSDWKMSYTSVEEVKAWYADATECSVSGTNGQESGTSRTQTTINCSDSALKMIKVTYKKNSGTVDLRGGSLTIKVTNTLDSTGGTTTVSSLDTVAAVPSLSPFVSPYGLFASSALNMQSLGQRIRSRSMSHEEMEVFKAEKTKTAIKSQKKTADASSKVNNISSASNTTSSLSWSGLSRDFDNASSSLDLAVEKLKASARKVSETNGQGGGENRAGKFTAPETGLTAAGENLAEEVSVSQKTAKARLDVNETIRSLNERKAQKAGAKASVNEKSGSRLKLILLLSALCGLAALAGICLERKLRKS